MARIRTIKPEFPQSETLGTVSREARLCFILLWTQADDSGRLRGNSRMLASLLYPYDDDAKNHIDGWLTELEGVNCIRRYVVDGSTYIDIPKWLEHQKIDKPSKSRLPAFDEGSRTLAKAREDSPADLGRDRDLGRDQGKDQGPEEGAAAPVAAAYSFEGVVIRLSRTDYDRWRKTFSNIPNFDAELMARDAWLADQPADVRKRWFQSTSTHLRNRDADYAARRAAAEAPKKTRITPLGVGG